VDTRALHLLVELHGCNRTVLDDLDAIQTLMRRAARAAGATVVQEVFHRYSPQGVTGVVIIEESHFSVHTWPELGCAAVDFYTCGRCQPVRAAEVLREGLSAERVEMLTLRRGLRRPEGSIHIDAHSDEGLPEGVVPLARQG
jgi:S-adenosylmethionine decarboxylase